MKVSILQENEAMLPEYALIPISFSAPSIYEVSVTESGVIELTERQLGTPIAKNYDATSEGPSRWPSAFDISNWAFFVAYVDGARAGGAAVALRTRDVDMLEGRDDLAVLWDLRVAPEHRGQGIGAALIETAERWAKENGATVLKVETQNINVAACRRYQRSGFVVRQANFRAYDEFPDEVQLLWYKDLSASSSGDSR